MYPDKLQEVIDFFEALPEVEKRENLVAYADEAGRLAPEEGKSYDLEDVRRDQECTDTVGVYMDAQEGRAYFKITLGPQVQTLTKAMASILCQGLNGTTLEDIIAIPQDFVPRIVGSELVRVRSQTVYYILSRMKGACKVYLKRQRSKEIDS